MRQAAASCFLHGRCLTLRSCHARLPAARPLKQAAQAAQAGAGGGAVRRRWCESVAFLVPKRADPERTHRLPFKHVTQLDLYNILNKEDAVGFDSGDGWLSRQLEDLPEGGTVRLVLSGPPSSAQQVRNLQREDDEETLAIQEQLAAFLRQWASEDSAGGSLTALPTKPFKRASGQDYVQLDAAVVAGSTLFLGECKRMLDEDSVGNLLLKRAKIRSAVSSNTSPDLAAALRGVTHIKLFLAGKGVRAGVSQEELASLAAEVGMGLVLPSGQGLGLVGTPPSAKPL
jgi:hypothetical protein